MPKSVKALPVSGTCSSTNYSFLIVNKTKAYQQVEYSGGHLGGDSTERGPLRLRQREDQDELLAEGRSQGDPQGDHHLAFGLHSNSLGSSCPGPFSLERARRGLDGSVAVDGDAQALACARHVVWIRRACESGERPRCGLRRRSGGHGNVSARVDGDAQRVRGHDTPTRLEAARLWLSTTQDANRLGWWSSPRCRCHRRRCKTRRRARHAGEVHRAVDLVHDP